MLITTTPIIEGKEIKEYRGIVFGEIMNVPYFLKGVTAGMISYAGGGRADEYEEELINARADALKEMMRKADLVGANAIVGVSVDYEVLGNIFMVIASGTAVIID